MNQYNQRIVNNKLGLLNLAEELDNISKACKVMGVSRDTFYRTAVPLTFKISSPDICQAALA